LRNSLNFLVFYTNFMRNFERRNNFNRDRGNSRGRGERRSTTMFDTVCDKCGRDCQVPFRPTGEKPVYCSNCYEKQSDNSSYRRDDRRDNRRSFDRFDRPERSEKTMHETVCDSCGNACMVPFKPTSGKAIFCDDCFAKKGNSRQDNSQIQEQIDAMNVKLDSALEMLRSLTIIKSVSEQKPIKSEAKVTEKKTAKKSVKKKATLKKAEKIDDKKAKAKK